MIGCGGNNEGADWQRPTLVGFRADAAADIEATPTDGLKCATLRLLADNKLVEQAALQSRLQRERSS